jgi:hypothetical protein
MTKSRQTGLEPPPAAMIRISGGCRLSGAPSILDGWRCGPRRPLCCMTRIYIFRRFFIPLRRHLRRVALSRYSTRSKLFALDVVFRKVRLSAINGYCRHAAFLIASAERLKKLTVADTRKGSGRKPEAFSNPVHPPFDAVRH